LINSFLLVNPFFISAVFEEDSTIIEFFLIILTIYLLYCHVNLFLTKFNF
jgi:hypothetical protein